VLSHVTQYRSWHYDHGQRCKVTPLSHYPLDELIACWKGAKLTPEQLIGQILLVLREHERRLRASAEARREGGDESKPGGES
jgi:hypothetical protein